MEELLERQWEQGSQFLMEQGQHFDSKSCLGIESYLEKENYETLSREFHSGTDKVRILWYLRDNFAYFSIKTYVVGTH